MRTRQTHLLVVAILAAASCCAAAQNEPPLPELTAATVEGNNAFALALYKELSTKEGNLFLCPYSISSALAMTWAGARGATAEQMAKVLRFGPEAEKVHAAFRALNEMFLARREKQGYELAVANALWGQQGYGFLPEFLDLTKTFYGAGLREVDFVGETEAARQTINRWVEEQTRERIKDLIQKGILDPNTRLVLTNAIYFKGDWAAPFEKKATREEDFTLADGTKVKVPMMNQTGEFGFAERPDVKALELPYAGDALSMVILLPAAHDGLPALEKSLNPEMLAELLRLRRREVIVAMPKFTMTRDFDLVKTLQAMGMSDPFNAWKADFSGMNGRMGLCISAVIHKAFVDVNEEGTEAAAATAVVMAERAAVARPPVFRADRPFLFLIRDRRTGAILFIGRVLDPRK